ncbi:MAG: hypothetical protein K2X52_06435 [Mycobacteriaceae bacterium]|nr:hypothetical protein [Mycobacteriaceae bacterium]
MFESWHDSREYPTLFRVDREVCVDIAHLFPPTGIRRDELPLFVKSGGLLLEPAMKARQIAWLRRSDGGWAACLQMPAGSANGRSRLTMQLWLPPEALSTEVG